MIVRWRRCVLALSALVLVSCGSKGEAQDGPASPRSAEAAAATAGSSAGPTGSAPSAAPSSSAAGSDAPAVKPPAVAPGAPGPALLSVRGGGLYQIHEGKLTRLSDEDPGELTASPDGAVYAHRGKVLRGGALEELPFGMFATFGIAKDGTVWSLDLERSVSKLAGSGKDRKWEKEALPAGTDTLGLIAVGADGQPVVASSDNLYSKKGGQWEVTPVTRLLPDAPSNSLEIEGLVRYRDVVLVLTSQGAVGLDGQKVELPPRRCSSSLYERIAEVWPSGELAVRCQGAAVIAGRDGKGTLLEARAAMPKAEEVTAVAIDGQGRRWMGTDAGLAILAPDGKALQRWEVGSLPGEVVSIAVVGAGPALPVSPDAPVKGNVKVRLFVEDKPLKGVEVEVCGHPRFLSYGKTPCEGQAAVISAKTDDAGVLKLAGVPRGNYGFTIKEAKGWSILSAVGAPECCTKVTAGGELDLGDIRIKASK